MDRSIGVRRLGAAVLVAALGATAGRALDQETSGRGDELPVTSGEISVTATRVPEDVERVPASVTVISGDELRARGATDLASALALAAGVTVAPGGDSGPAGSIPELWGLREFDAFLLVVDGVPWGGAFNPALPSLDLTNVERIEILRGSAPVLFGATSFVGVIQVIHRDPGAAGGRARVWGGNFGSGGVELSTPLPRLGDFRHSLTVDGERRGFRDDREELTRGHALYRSAWKAAGGDVRLDLDGTILRQDPASPHPREGAELSPLVPRDANHNPSDARLDEDRLHLVAGYARPLAGGDWTTTLAWTHSEHHNVRGFLRPELSSDPEASNADGFRQTQRLTDVYFDSHLALAPTPDLELVAGVDHLYGDGLQHSANFEYFTPLDGSSPIVSTDRHIDERTELGDRRDFSGLYAQAIWTPAVRWRVELGARLNRTAERRHGEVAPSAEEGGDGGEAAASRAEDGGGAEGDEKEGGEDTLTRTRLSGVLGVNWLAWSREDDAVWLYADVRNTFKPAAIDFGPEAEGEILDPETAESFEVGAKTRLLGGRVDIDLSAFQMDFENLVVSQAVGGLPTLVNAGGERFRGAEVESSIELRPDLRWRGSYAWHDATFTDYLRLFDGVPFQLRGNRLELSARHQAGMGLLWSPREGLHGDATVEYVGSRFLDKRNRALAPSYTIWSAGVGYRRGPWDLRLDGENLGDSRPPVAESELGDAQYYLLPARRVSLSLARSF